MEQLVGVGQRLKDQRHLRDNVVDGIEDISRSLRGQGDGFEEKKKKTNRNEVERHAQIKKRVQRPDEIQWRGDRREDV